MLNLMYSPIVGHRLEKQRVGDIALLYVPIHLPNK